MNSYLDDLRARIRNRPDLHGRVIFLSASFPSFKRHPEYRETTDIAEISSAVVSLARAAFHADGTLVFGGHPTITPLLLSVAKEMIAQAGAVALPSGPRVIAYQSSVFDQDAPSEVRELSELEGGLGRVVKIPAAPGERPRNHADGSLDPASVERSLKAMRDEMLGQSGAVAAIYVGGMIGIDREHALARELGIPRHYVIAAPGGAARQLRPLGPDDAPPALLRELETSRHYPLLAARIVADIVRAR